MWLLTSGLSLAKHARRAAELFDAITVSLDGTDRETYPAIRGLDAFDKVCEGIRASAAPVYRSGLRVTLQRANYRELPAFVELAKGSAPAKFRFSRSTSPIRTPSADSTISAPTSRCAPRICPYSSNS